MNYRVSEATANFLNHLHRGGKYANFWMLEEAKFYTDKSGEPQKCKRTFWFEVGQMPAVVEVETTEHVYFSVFPTTVRHRAHDRTSSVDVAAINCLFAEFDAKNSRDGSMKGAWERVVSIDPRPSIIVNSGGGYHCYWLLDQPFGLTDDNRQGVKELLYRWVDFVKGERESKDMARVLRVPYTRNVKEEYAPNYPTVLFNDHDMECLYDLGELAAYAPVKSKPVSRPQVTPRRYAATDFSANPAQRYIDKTMDLVHAASHGNGLHFALREASCKLGRVVGAGLLSEAEAISMLEDSVIGKARDMGNAANTIRSGITLGQSNPFVIREYARREPVITPRDRSEIAYGRWAGAR
jgi:hypothetical protein